MRSPRRSTSLPPSTASRRRRRCQSAASRTSGRACRSFVADKNLVVGYDPKVEGFFWLAGQGGYGIQTGEAAGRLAASLALGKGMPADIAALGVAKQPFRPHRFTHMTVIENSRIVAKH